MPDKILTMHAVTSGVKYARHAHSAQAKSCLKFWHTLRFAQEMQFVFLEGLVIAIIKKVESIVFYL